jgi:hypothetical protein
MSTYYQGEDNDNDNEIYSDYININNFIYVNMPSLFDNLQSFVEDECCEGMILNVPNGIDCACESTWCFRNRRELHKCKYNLSTKPDEITKIPKECEPCGDTCSICLDILDTCCVITKCKHKFHEKCISKYFETARRELFGQVKCPMCRSRVWPATFMDLNEVFEKHKNCNCCSRHKVNRPKTLMPLNTGRVEWCLNIKRLKNNSSIREFNCKCPCRHILRWDCCRRLQDL